MRRAGGRCEYETVPTRTGRGGGVAAVVTGGVALATCTSFGGGAVVVKGGGEELEPEPLSLPRSETGPPPVLPLLGGVEVAANEVCGAAAPSSWAAERDGVVGRVVSRRAGCDGETVEA